MITEEEIIRRLEYLEMMNNNVNKYGGCEGKITWSGIYPKSNKARIDLVKDDELYENLFSIYLLIRISGSLDHVATRHGWGDVNDVHY